jgi:hypothetical protein
MAVTLSYLKKLELEAVERQLDYGKKISMWLLSKIRQVLS